MSLKFFRKRQKLIFIIMIVLMVSFLVSFQGINSFMQTKRDREVIGSGNFGELTLGDTDGAAAAFDVISRLSGAFQAVPEQYQVFYTIMQMNPDAEKRQLAYALLLQEAAEKNIVVTSSDIDQAVSSYKSGKFPYDKFIDQLTVMFNMSNSDVRAIIGGWLKVIKCFNSGTNVYPPSRSELEKLYADIHEQMSLKVAVVDAKDYVDKTPQPTNTEIEKQFEEYRTREKGKFVSIDKPTFGYVIPAKVDVTWLMVNLNAMVGMSKPTMAQMHAYYDKNKEAYVEKQDKDKKTYKPFKDVQRDVYDAVAYAESQQKTKSILTGVTSIIRKYMTGSVGEIKMANAYAAAAKEMLQPADDIMARKIPVVVVQDQPLFMAVRQIAELAQPKIDTIVLPFAKSADFSIDPMKKVSVSAQDITVADVMKKLFAENKISGMDKVTWSTFELASNTVFPSNLLPIRIGNSGLQNGEQLMKDPILGKSYCWQVRGSLPQIALSVEALEPKNTGFKVNQPAPETMCVSDANSGMVFWAVSQVEQQKSPESITPEIKKQIIADIRLERALQLAAVAAGGVKTPAELDKFIKDGKGRQVDTKLFSRLTSSMSRYGQSTYQPTIIRVMKFINPAVDAYFINDAFKQLAPDSLEPGQYTQASDKLMHLTLPCQECVIVARRVDFKPALASNFKEEAKKYEHTLDTAQTMNNYAGWFTYANIATRCDFHLAADVKNPESQE